MALQTVDIPHDLTAAEVRARLEGAVPKLESTYGARCTWKNESELTVARPGLTASVKIEPARVRVELELGLILRAFKDKILGGITRELGGIFGAKPSAPPSAD